MCAPQVEGTDLDAEHWFCLREAMWSEVPAVQVVSLRLLKRLTDADWASLDKRWKKFVQN